MLYDTISTTLSKPLEKPVKQLTDTLENATISMSDDIKKSLNINSTISVPGNLRELFTTLRFKTSSDNTGLTYPLSLRGDGIQSRHIPMILKYISEQDNLTRGAGSVRVTTIWGYEEPENNLEMKRCFEMANEMHEISRNLQMFITTHSPAFYLKANEENTFLFSVYQEESDKDTFIKKIRDSSKLNENLGIMQLISPFIEEVVNEKEITIKATQAAVETLKEDLKKYKKIVKETGLSDVPTIFVEGKQIRNT